jgi:hypothetical protein
MTLICFILLFETIDSKPFQSIYSLTLKSVLLDLLKTTHYKDAWSVSLNKAIGDLSLEQANRREKNADHSIAEIITHIIFWNQQELKKFLDQPESEYSGDNNETFSAIDVHEWPATIKKADHLLSEWENAIEAADEKKLEKWSGTIGQICTHNAYHTGQIVYIRKIQGSWNQERGVK